MAYCKEKKIQMKKKIIIISAILLMFAGCDKQRDLYNIASPLLEIRGDWVPSLGIADMNGRATAMLYKGNAVAKEFFYKPNSVTTKVSKGEYDILLFNGMMFSEENTNLDHIFFRNTNRAQEFEAVVVEVAPNNRLSRATDEYIASNDMELLTTAHTKLFVEGEYQYYQKYINGRRSDLDFENYVEQVVELTPVAVSYSSQVVVHLVNPSSAAIANGSLRGFVGSVFMNTGEPSDFKVTHQLKLNNLKITNKGTSGNPSDPEKGTIESPWFVTFGPPLKNTNHQYKFEISIILKNGNEYNHIFDLNDQVDLAIKRIKSYREAPTGLSISLTIPLETSIELPVIGPNESIIDVNDWGDDEIIRVPIK